MGRSQCGGIVNQFSRIREIDPSCLGKALIWGAIVSNVCSLRYPYSDNRAGSGYFRSTSGEPGFPGSPMTAPPLTFSKEQPIARQASAGFRKNCRITAKKLSSTN